MYKIYFVFEDMSNQFVLRRAEINDSKALSELCKQTFRETFIVDYGISFDEKDLETQFFFFS